MLGQLPPGAGAGGGTGTLLLDPFGVDEGGMTSLMITRESQIWELSMGFAGGCDG